MSQFIQSLIDNYTHTEELYITKNNLDRFETNDGWQIVNTLNFHLERKLKREIQDLEFWLPRQESREATAKTNCQSAHAAYRGDEISTTNYKSRAAFYRAQKFATQLMRTDLAAAQSAYKELTGASYTSIEQQPVEDIPEDVRIMMEEMASLMMDEWEQKAANEPEVKAKKKA